MTFTSSAGVPRGQMELAFDPAPVPVAEHSSDVQPDLSSYDAIVVATSGGKDSLGCLLECIEKGAPMERIELWHHDVDDREGSTLFDWPVTRSYVSALAEAFGLPLYFSWKQGGLEREMLRNNARTAPISFQTPEGEIRSVGGVSGKLGTRLQFPQVTADLTTRFCSLRKNRRIERSYLQSRSIFRQENAFRYWRASPGERRASALQDFRAASHQSSGWYPPQPIRRSLAAHPRLG
ncbi:hypothetical protein MicloDRAFT_00027280 [Microvirga lotononidis]|uniref:PAPS reductase/FAD synthetase family protein n=1 Tax=Microvirga lotononidis TaxID=864069 RepID=I4YX98_9HYPH|nr:hypothetical protein MicloDRAFT_00027280 [Microvirga lotononidis]